MNFYEKISKKKVVIPHRFSMNCGQLDDLRNHAPGMFSLISAAFTFGYMQGVRAAKAGKAGDVA